MYRALAHEKPTVSGDWREPLDLTTHRYMREDMAIGLSFLTSVACRAGVSAPVAESLLSLGGAVCGETFQACGRTLENLGLASLTREEISMLLHEAPLDL